MAAAEAPRVAGPQEAQARAEGVGTTGVDPALDVSGTGTPPAGATGDVPSGGSTPALAAASPSPAARVSDPVLKPPVPLDQPPLHPVLRATILPRPGSGSAVEEGSVRGRVRVRLLIRSDGAVAIVEVIVSSGNTSLDEAARRGLLRWRFVPATRDGVPIDAYLLIWITFSE